MISQMSLRHHLHKVYHHITVPSTFAVPARHRCLHVGTIPRQQSKFDVLIDQIVQDPETVRQSLKKLASTYGEKEYNTKVAGAIGVHYGSSPYELSLFQCLNGSKKVSISVNECLSEMISNDGMSDIDKFNMVRSYLGTLSKISQLNNFTNMIVIKEPILNSIISITPRSEYKDLFMLLLNSNVCFKEDTITSKLTYALSHGTADEFYTFVNAQLLTEESKNDPNLIMQNNYTYKMLSDVLRIYSKLQNSKKFAEVISIMFQKVLNDKSLVSKDLLISRVYEHLMAYVLRRYDLRPSLLLLQDMQNNKIPISNRILFMLLNSLTIDLDLQNYAILTNYILNEYRSRKIAMSPTTVQVITNQMLKIMQNTNFSHNDLRVIIGYALLFFSKGEPLLQQLGLLPIAYGEGYTGEYEKAQINLNLNMLQYPPITSLTQVYIACFRYMNYHDRLTLSELRDMYIRYRDEVISVQERELDDEELQYHPFSRANLNESILKLFMKQLLYRFTDFDSAIELMSDFTSKAHLNKLSNSYIYDFAINHYLKNNDLTNAFKWFDQLTQNYKVKINLRPLVGLIYRCHRVDSETSRYICRKLLVEQLAPLIKSNVHTPHLNKKIRDIIFELDLEEYFDMSLLGGISESDPSPGFIQKDEINLLEEFNEELIDSYALSSLNEKKPVEEEIVIDDETVYDLGDLETGVELEDTVDIIETTEEPVKPISTPITKQIKSEKPTILKDLRERPVHKYNSTIDQRLHPATTPQPRQRADLQSKDVLDEITTVSTPTRHHFNDEVFKKRKNFLKMLQQASNSDMVTLIIKFLDQCQDQIIFYRTNHDHRNFRVVNKRSRKSFN